MKLLFFIILFCVTPSGARQESKTRSTKVCLAGKETAANLEMLPSGLLFQF
jgi:hypothetical protein